MKKSIRHLITAVLAIAAAVPVFAEAPTVTTNSYVARGNDFALGRLTVKGAYTVAGFCYSTTNTEPTIDDNISDKEYDNNGTLYRMSNLEPATWYYVRAYATNAEGETGYGDVVKVPTIPKANIQWKYNPDYAFWGIPRQENGQYIKDENGNFVTEDGWYEGTANDVQNERILAAIESAIATWSSATSLNGFNPTFNFHPGVNTADCSYGGWIRIGPRPDNQSAGTLLHEMNHGVGVGQHSYWYGPSNPWRVDGTRGDWKGTRANAIVAFLENNDNEVLHGDNQHMWPYGINGSHEDKKTEIQHLANGLITQAINEDIVPPVAGKWHPGAWILPENVKFYIKCSDPAKGMLTSYVYEDTETMKPVYDVMADEDALADDIAAWYFDFDPVTTAFAIRNAKTGHFLCNKDTGHFAISDAETPGDLEKYILTEWPDRTEVNGVEYMAYGISLYTSNSHEPLSLSVTGTNGINGPKAFRMDGRAQQRWLLLTADQIPALTAGVDAVKADTEQAKAYDVYDISGRLVRSDAFTLDGLAAGIYIMGGKKYIKR